MSEMWFAANPNHYSLVVEYIPDAPERAFGVYDSSTEDYVAEGYGLTLTEAIALLTQLQEAN